MRSAIYDALISGMTADWYGGVLVRLPTGARLLDVGIGTGRALLANREVIVGKELHVTGIDIDRSYVDACRRAVAGAGLGDRVDARLESVYDHAGGPYDAIYFSASFMLLPDPVAALEHVAALLAPGGQLYFTQTFEHQAAPLMERLKPLLRYLTSIDFGQVTYEPDFRRTLERANAEITGEELLKRKAKRSYKLFVARPRSRQAPARAPVERV
jgi:SAM-dependent methyltransferase